MNQAGFLRTLERALRGFPDAERAAILADYQRYFADGVAAGRDEADVAASLGHPARLAAELRLSRDVHAWNTPGGGRSPLRTLRSLFSLVAVDVLIWLPALIAAVLLLLVLAAGMAALAYGLFTLLVETFDDPLGGAPAALLRALAWLSAGAGLLLVSNIAIHGLASLLARRRRTPDYPDEVSP